MYLFLGGLLMKFLKKLLLKLYGEKMFDEMFLRLYGEKMYRVILYRRKMPVKKYQLLGKTDLFPVCPRCRNTMERDYQSFCDRCGQCLEWLE